MNLIQQNKKPIWQTPWQYSESIFIVLGIYLVGVALQLFLGTFKFSNIVWPVNIIVGLTSLVFVVLLSLKRKSHFFYWLSAAPLSISLIALLIMQTIIMGLTPQISGQLTERPDVFDILGFTRMTSSWPFVLTMFFTIIALCAAIVNRLKTPIWKDYAFYLNHVGLLVFLFAAGYGAADMKRYVMYVEVGNEIPEWRVYNDKKDVLDLPLAIKLNDFVLEEYAPKLAIIHRETGKAIPYEAPVYFQIDSLKLRTSIGDWDIEVHEFIAEAMRESDKSYRKVPMPGACPAANVTVINKKNKQKYTGWVSCGNFAQLYMPLTLTNDYSLVMTRPEAKRFASYVDVITASGQQESAVIEVNKPFTVESWNIYQYGYDTDTGKASSYSSFELVYDPWINLVYAGIFIFSIGCFCMFWIGNNKRRKGKND